MEAVKAEHYGRPGDATGEGTASAAVKTLELKGSWGEVGASHYVCRT